MPTWIRQFLAAPVFEDDEDKTRVAGLVNIILLGFVAIAVLFSILAPILHNDPVPELVVLAVMNLVRWGALSLMRSDRVRLTSVLLSSVLWVVITLLALASGGIHGAPFIHNYVSVTIIASLLLGGRAGVASAVLSVVTGLGMFYAEVNGFLPAPLIPDAPLSPWIGLTANIVMAALLLFLADHSINKSLERAHDSERALGESNRELQLEITERKRAEEALRVSEERFTLAVQGANDGIWDWDIQNNSLYWSPRMKELLGYADDELDVDFDTFDSLLHPDDREHTAAAIEAHLKERGLYDVEQRMRTKSGEYHWFRARGQALWGETGNPIRMVGSTSDITERKRAEEELIRLSNAVRMSTDSIVITDLEGKIIEVNEATLKMYGTDDKGDLVGRNSFDLIAPEDREKAFADMVEVLEKGYIKGREYHVITDGNRIPMEMSVSVLKDADSKPIGFVGITRDITERKRAERLLQALNEASLAMERALTQEEIFTAVARELKKLGFSCIVFLTGESQSKLLIRYISYEAGALKALQKLTGLKIENLSIPIETADVYREVILERRAAFIENVEDVTRQFLPKPLKKFTGQIMRMLKIAKSIPAPLIVEDKVIGVLSVESDDLTENDVPAITAFAHQMAAAWRKAQLLQDLERRLEELKQTQTQLIQAGKLAAIGQLVAGVAHELNNPLTSVVGYSELLLRADCSEGIKRDLERINRQAVRAARIVENLLTFARRREPRKESININDVIEKSLELQAHQLELDHISIVKELEEALPPIMADSFQMQQVFMNIISNAHQALRDWEGERRLRVRSELAGDMIHLEFADSGPGIPAEVMERLFEPFFTTREVGEGTGLGLSISYGIVEAHGGRIWAENKVGKGATFIVEIPVKGD